MGASRHDLSLLHHVSALRYGEGEVKILLDQQDAKPHFSEEEPQGIFDTVDQHRRHPFRRFVEDEQLRR